MSRRHALTKRLAGLTDIGDILSAMKSLALMETRRLGEFMESQRRRVATIEAAAADFLAWHPDLATAPEAGHELCLVIGSQQGFCGDYNDAMAERLQRYCGKDANAPTHWVVLGERLSSRLADDPRMMLALPGATVAHEVPAVLLRLSREIARLLALRDLAGHGFSVLHHCADSGDIRLRRLLPLRDLPPPAPASHAPDLNLSPADFLAGLHQHYLHAALNEAIYSALLVENRQRQNHMDRALNRLDETVERLRLAANRQRQEDITEEIELLLLAGEAAQPAAPGLAAP
jgi:F-type H+-transporting ATPase subunit gamma